MSECPVALSLGGNQGDAPGTIAMALRLLEARGSVRLGAVSKLYRTASWGPVAQDDFANLCALGETNLAPLALLAEVKAIETLLGRTPGPRWGPRLVDIDILTYGGQDVDLPGLRIPHASLFERAFVLVPLAEIAPGLEIAGRRVADAAAALGREGVALWT